MPVVAVFAFVDIQMTYDMVVVFSYTCGRFGVFTRIITDFLNVAHPTAFGLEDLTRI
jgi:hypothetical protein